MHRLLLRPIGDFELEMEQRRQPARRRIHIRNFKIEIRHPWEMTNDEIRIPNE